MGIIKKRKEEKLVNKQFNINIILNTVLMSILFIVFGLLCNVACGSYVNNTGDDISICYQSCLIIDCIIAVFNILFMILNFIFAKEKNDKALKVLMFIIIIIFVAGMILSGKALFSAIELL